LDRIAVVCDRTIVVALGSPRVAAAVKGKGVTRIEPDSFGVAPYGAVEVTHAAILEGTIIMKLGQRVTLVIA